MKKQGCRGTHVPRARKRARQDQISIAEALIQQDDAEAALAAVEQDMAERKAELEAVNLARLGLSLRIIEDFNSQGRQRSAYDGGARPGGLATREPAAATG